MWNLTVAVRLSWLEEERLWCNDVREDRREIVAVWPTKGLTHPLSSCEGLEYYKNVYSLNTQMTRSMVKHFHFYWKYTENALHYIYLKTNRATWLRTDLWGHLSTATFWWLKCVHSKRRPVPPLFISWKKIRINHLYYIINHLSNWLKVVPLTKIANELFHAGLF